MEIHVYLYDHPSGDKEVRGGGGTNVSLNRSHYRSHDLLALEDESRSLRTSDNGVARGFPWRERERVRAASDAIDQGHAMRRVYAKR